MNTGMSDGECNVNVQDEAPAAGAAARGAQGFSKIVKVRNGAQMRRQDSKIFRLRNGAQIGDTIWRQYEMYTKCKGTFRNNSTLLNVKKQAQGTQQECTWV